MSKLENASSELVQVLAGVITQCWHIREELSLFEKHASTFFANRLHLKLAIIRAWIPSRIEQLRKEHGDAGYICVFLSMGEGLNPIWVEDKRLVEDKAWYAGRGITIFPVEEAFGLINELDAAVDQDEWQKVTDFMEKYGRATRLDWSKLPEV